MNRLTIEQLGPRLKEQRGNRGIREVALEIGISAATLSRIESGKQPDLETFARVCKWLDVNPGEVLGFQETQDSTQNQTSPTPNSLAFGHYKADRTMKPETVKRLSELILAVQDALEGEGLV